MFHFIGWMALVLQIIGIILYATTIVISTSYTDRLIRSLALLASIPVLWWLWQVVVNKVSM